MARSRKAAEPDLYDEVLEVVKEIGLNDYDECPVGEVAKELEETPHSVAKLVYRAELEAFPKVEIKGSTDEVLGKRIREAYEGGMRWDRISVRSNLSLTDVKELYEEAGGDPDFKARSARAAEKAAAKEEAKPARRSRRGAKAKDDGDEEEEEAKPARSRRSRRTRTAKAEASGDEGNGNGDEEEAEEKPTRRRRRTRRGSPS